LIEPEKEILPEKSPEPEWWNDFREDADFLKKYDLPKIPVEELEKN
jgi:hypothetical protein